MCREVYPSETLLFRYCALTFNSHRIHYDANYAQADEAYPGLLVHGPLVATLLLDLIRSQFEEQAVSRFAFRGHSPAVVREALLLALKRADGALTLRAFAENGRMIMSASASLSES